MDGDERRLDGNAMAGLLGEIFPFEMSMARALCAHCGRMEPAGAELVYADAPGFVMRCVHCQGVMLTIVHSGRRYWFEMQGVACLEMES